MRVLKWLDKNLEIGCMAVLLIIMTALSFTNVVLRYCFSNALSWSDEVCCYVWQSVHFYPYRQRFEISR